MIWKIVQAVIFTAVLFSNVHWQWTPNAYLASLIGIGAAFCVTLGVQSATDLLRSRGLGRQKHVRQR